MKWTRRNTLKTLLSGVALSMPLHNGLMAQTATAPRTPANSDDLFWVSKPDQLQDQRIYNLRTAKSPHFRALCLSEDGVAQAVAWAQEHSIPFSVQSGGHCYEGLSQSDHLIIDLRYLNATSLLAPDTLTTGPGATLGKINTTTAPVAHALPAGYCQSVGIGGHIGGGGLGVLSREYGLTCDHLKSARVLVANGGFVTASESENPNLFWALRGGGSGSFGIATSFTFRLQHVPQATFAEFHWILDTKIGAQFLSDWQEVSIGFDRRISCFLYLNNQKSGHVLVRVRMVSIAPPTQTTDAIAKLNGLAATLIYPVIVQGDFQQIANQMWPPHHDSKANTKIVSNFLAAPARAETWFDVLSALETHRAQKHRLSIEVLGGAINNLPPEKTAYFHRHKPKFLAQFGANLPANKDSTHAIATLRAVQEQLKPSTIPGTYVNYPDTDLIDWPEQYWGSNYERLRRVKRQYDPDNLFNHAQSIIP